MSNDNASIDAIRKRMQHVRREITEEVDQLVSNARDLTDWRYYVRTYPWLSVGVAAAAGFMIAPKGPRPVRMSDADRETMARLDRFTQSQTEVPIVKRLGQMAAKTAALAAIRWALTYAGQRFVDTRVSPSEVEEPV